MICPRCQTALHENARYCGCGWKKFSRAGFDEPEQQQHVKCAHDACFLSAKVRIKTATGWANLCERHYEQHYATEALANLDKWGMERQADETRAEWTARMRRFVKSKIKGLGKLQKASENAQEAA